MAQKAYDSERQDYKTPPEIYEKLLRMAEIDKFDIDVCCSEKNIPAKRHFLDLFYDGLTEKWQGFCFLNPPFKYTQKWVKKAVESVDKNDAVVFAVIPADRMETKYYQDYILKNPNCVFCFLPNKIGFIIPGHETEKPKPSQKIMIAIFCNQHKLLNCHFSDSGFGKNFNTVFIKGGQIEWEFSAQMKQAGNTIAASRVFAK